MSGVRAALYVMVLAAAFASAQTTEPASTRKQRLPVATGVALLIVSVPSLAQLTVAPWLLEDLQRNWDAINHGQIWRLVTSLVVQDGGWSGTLFNLVSLTVIGVGAEKAWGPGRWTLIALVAGIGAQIWGRLVQPVGAGNSVAVFGLATSLAVLAFRSGSGVTRLLGVVSLLAAAALFVVGDIHGGAAMIGAVLGRVLSSGRALAERHR